MSDAGPLADLTRWNRTGLSRFDYVDGDAAVWLEELRIAMLGLYLRGGDAETRLPQYWRDIYLRAPEDWPDVSAAAARWCGSASPPTCRRSAKPAAGALSACCANTARARRT